ncbi:hypothetical protein R5R35_001336 [Gryllus longicercus]|uniref:Uracil-DNA glycosylase n=1 Tax=Gryllus longicercus TaxID=2509291 RepID=A0AAN9Z2N7_9ORTH
MSGQKSILNFLKPVSSVKRPLCEGNNANFGKSEEPLEKKVKSNVNEVGDKPAVRKEWPNEIIAKIKLTSRRYQALHMSIGHSWFRALEPEFKKDYFMKLSRFLVQERSQKRIFPPEEHVWTWTQRCDISDIKVVILGQDPYHNPGQAHGLCFSVPAGIPPPPSLVNMYHELETDIPGFVRPNHGCLDGWAEQGVLLLNACLTVQCNAANSHRDQGWEQLTDAVIRTLSARNHSLVFLLWGAYAQKKAVIVDKKKHHLLKAPHPSPLSAHRGFFGCKHFSSCNRLLKEAGKKPIDWNYLPLPGENTKKGVSQECSNNSSQSPSNDSSQVSEEDKL